MPEDYDIDQEQRILQDWQRFEEEKLNRPEAKIVPFTIAYQDREVNATIIEKG